MGSSFVRTAERAQTMERILILDDDALCRKLVVKSLQKAGYKTLEVESASAAITLLQSEEPIALLITDIMMPEMDGLTLLSRIRCDPTLVRLPVLICTSLNSREAIIKAGHLGIAGYLLKPVDVRRLRTKVQKILKAEPQPLEQITITLSRLDLEEGDYLEMLDELVGRLLSGINEIQELGARRDHQRLSTCLSALHGAAKSLGAERVADVLVRQLHASERTDFRVIQALLGELRREVTRLQLAVASVRAKTVNAPDLFLPDDTSCTQTEESHA